MAACALSPPRRYSAATAHLTPRALTPPPPGSDGDGVGEGAAAGSQPPHAPANSMAATCAQAAASSIRGPSGDVCSQSIRSPHEHVMHSLFAAAAAHASGVHAGVPHLDHGGRGGEGGGGGSASIET